MTRTVEYCVNNVTSEFRNRLHEFDGPEIVEKRCLQRCGDCYRGSILIVDGRLETASSHADLVSTLPEADR